MKATSGSDRIAALEDVFRNGYMHRDVSETNIVILRPELGGDCIGLVIDWEYACKVDRKEAEEAREYLRTVGA